MADINITHSWADGEPGGGSGGGASDSSADRLGALLERLEASMDRLNLSLALFAERIVPGLTPGGGNGTGGGDGSGKNDAKSFLDKFLSELKNSSSMIVGTMVAGAAVTAARYMNNKANAINAMAGATGSYFASNLRGEAAENADGYIKSIYNTQSQLLQQQNTNLHEGVYGTGGAIAGEVLGKAIGVIGSVATGNELGALKSLLLDTGGGAAGAAVGGAFGKLQAADGNARIEVAYAQAAQIAANNMRAAQTEWGNSYSRWGSNSMGKTGIMQGVDVYTDKALESYYGQGTKNGQNYNQVVDMAKYLTVSPIDQAATGDLGQAVQNFKQAGVDVKDLGKVAGQSAQFMALNNKTVEEFSKVYQNASNKFGALFSTDTMQTALNLQMLGYTQDQSQNIAFQSQFNPNQQALMANFRNQDYSSYMRREALSGTLGFDINRSLAKGELVGASPKTIENYKKEIAEYTAGGKPLSQLPYLNAAGISLDMFSSMINHVTAGTVNTKGDVPDAGKNPAEEIAEALRTGLSNITNMTVNAQNVMIMNNGQISTVDTPGRWKENINRTFAAPDIDTSTFSPSAFGQLQRERNSQVQSQQDEAVKGLYVVHHHK
jgi:hypothetical protein